MLIKLSRSNVMQYLLDLDLCGKQDIEPANIVFRPSINSISLIAFLPYNHQLLIQQNPKQLSSNSKNYINDELNINSFLNSCSDLAFCASLSYSIIHFDRNESILIYKIPNGHTTIENYYRKKNCFPLEVSKILGTTLANFHQESLKSQSCKNYFNTISKDEYCYKFPHPEHILEKPTSETINENLPPEGLKFLGYYQSSKNLTSAVTKLVATRKHYCLTLNNYKFDNILIPINSNLKSNVHKQAAPAIKIVNWNSCSWGDPAFDLGTIISSYFLIWLQSTATYSISNLDQYLKSASIPFNVIQPLIESCVRSYINEFPVILEDYSDFINRVIQFAGLALIYNLLSDIQSFRIFNVQCIYILQIAKNLLCKPETFVKSLFSMNISKTAT